MLSKQKFLPTKSLFIAAGIAACGLAAVQQSANALSINFVDRVGDDYNYTLTIPTGEAINPGDTVEFANLLDVTGGVTSPTLSFFFDQPVITSSSALFTASGASGGLSGTIGTFTISSTANPAPVNYSINSGLFTGSVTGPATNVPFEFSPGLGLILSGTLIGALQLRSKFSKKEEINF